jgi:hypothetical protein
MNWSCVLVVGVFIIAIVDCLVRGRKHHVEPVRHLKKMQTATCGIVHTLIARSYEANLVSIGKRSCLCLQISINPVVS